MIIKMRQSDRQIDSETETRLKREAQQMISSSQSRERKSLFDQTAVDDDDDPG